MLVTAPLVLPSWCSARAGFTLHPQSTIKRSHPMGQLVPLQHLWDKQQLTRLHTDLPCPKLELPYMYSRDGDLALVS